MASKRKNLCYESEEPTFLRRLRGEVGGVGGVGGVSKQDRPANISKRLQKSVEDDEPTYVLEGTHDTISKEGYEALMKVKSGDMSLGLDGASSKSTDMEHMISSNTDSNQGETPKTSQQKVTEAGHTTKKRKAVKVIGLRDDDEPMGSDRPQPNIKPPRTSKVKRKHIKISFNDE